MNSKLMALISLILMALSVCGVAYSHWSETLYIQGIIETGDIDIEIGSYKRLSEYDEEIIVTQPDEDTLQVSSNIVPGWYVWLGIIVPNEGTLPASITYSIMTDNHNIWESYFNHNEYFYGPYKTSPPQDVWAKVQLEPPPEDYVPPPPPGGAAQPPDLDPGYKFVAWQLVEFSETYTEDPFTITITVIYTATFNTWQDSIYIQLKLACEGSP